MAGDQKGELTKDKKLILKATLQQKMKTSLDEYQQKSLHQTDDFRQKSKKRMHNQNLEPKPPESIQNHSSKTKCYKQEEAGRGQHSVKQPANTLNRHHQISHPLNANNHSSYSQIVTKPQLYVFTGEGDYLEWERTIDKWLCYHRIMKKEALAYVISQLKGKAYKWLMQEEDERNIYKEPAITTWESLKLLLRNKYAPKGHTSVKSPRKDVLSTTEVKSENSETKMTAYEKEKSNFKKEMLKMLKQLDKKKTEPSSVLSQDTQGNIKTAISDYCTNVSTSLEEEQMATEELKEERGNGTYEKKEVSDCLPWLKDQGETNLLRNYECSLHSSHSDFVENAQACEELTCFEPLQPSSLVSVSQVVEKDSPEKAPEDATQGEQQNSLQPETIHKSLPFDLQKHCKKANVVSYEPEMFVKVSAKDIKRFGLEKVKDFCVSNSVFENMFKSFSELKPVELFDQKRFQHDKNNISGHILSLDQFLKHSQSFDNYEKVFEFDLDQSEFCFWQPCDSFARTNEKRFVVSFPWPKLVADDFLAFTYLLNEPRLLHEPKLHHSEVRFEIVKSANISEFEIVCLCADNDSKRVGLFFDDILVYNTFFDKHLAPLKLEIIDFGCIVLCLVIILVYNTFFDKITHLTCPKEAEKGTGEKRGCNAQSIKNESLAKLELQQTNLESCLAASFDIGAVQGSYLNNQRELSHKTNCYGNLTHQGLTSTWNHIKSFSDERVMECTNQVILSLLCLNFSELSASQSYQWRPGEHAEVSDHVFKISFLNYTDMMHLFLSKEPCADYEKAWKHTRRNYKREEDQRFKPSDLDQHIHQDVPGFILIKEEPPDAAYKPKPSINNFGLRLLLYDNLLCANLFCFIVSGAKRTKLINLFCINEPVSNNAYQRGLQGKCNLILNFNVTDLVPFAAGKTDLRSNLFQEGGNDVILDQLDNEDRSTKEWSHEPDQEEVVAAEEHTNEECSCQEQDVIIRRHFDQHSSYYEADHHLGKWLVCTLFPLIGFVPLGFPIKVFNEATSSLSHILDD